MSRVPTLLFMPRTREEVVVRTMPETIRALVQSDLTAAGVELWDVEVTRDTIRVLVVVIGCL